MRSASALVMAPLASASIIWKILRAAVWAALEADAALADADAAEALAEAFAAASAAATAPRSFIP